ncbi:MAG TPA: tetratricopeptide repeat protein, partial [Methylophilaceae bacterium]|nr:tetratricopeptide repeat protein [Methylophilaceae bacterium]
MPIRLTPKLAIASAVLLIAFNATAQAESDSAKPKTMQTELTSDFVFKYLVGEIAGQRGDLGLASNLFLNLAKSSRDPRLAERAAKVAVYGNNAKTAVQAANLWAELDPASVEAQQATTEMLLSTGNLADAKPHLKKLLVKEETRANGFLYLNNLFTRQPDKKAVLKLVQELAKPYPKLPEAHFTVAHAAWAAGNDKLAISEMHIADKLRPGWELNAILQGQVLFGQSPDTAIDFYRNFLGQHPEANEVRMNLARTLVNQKRLGEAKPEFVKLAQASKDSPEILVVVGLLSFQAEDYTEAEQYFQQVLATDFRDKDQIYLYLGQVAEKQKKDDRALTWYNKVEPGERYLDAKLDIAYVLARTQGTDGAIKMLNDLSDLNNEQMVLVIQTQANLLVQAKRHREAYDLLDKAVKNLPNTPGIIYDYAMAAEKLDYLDVVERELRKLIQIKPDSAQAYNALGYSLADRNIKLDEARTLIEKALELSPNDHFI